MAGSKRLLVLLVIVTALLVKFWPFKDPPIPPDHDRNALSVRGVRLGMARADVLQKLGPPAQEAESDVVRHFSVARYQKTPWDQRDPQVTYSAQGRVVEVTGRSLEWAGGSLTTDLTERDALGLFPESVELSRANYHPGGPGRYFCAGRNLMIFTESTGLFSPHRFDRAQLAVPYFMRSFHPAEFRNSVILETSARIKIPNRSRLLKAKVVGCFQCGKVLPGKPKWTVTHSPATEPNGVCPYCDHDTLLGGVPGEITPTYLKKVHDAWLEP